MAKKTEILLNAGRNTAGINKDVDTAIAAGNIQSLVGVQEFTKRVITMDGEKQDILDGIPADLKCVEVSAFVADPETQYIVVLNGGTTAQQMLGFELANKGLVKAVVNVQRDGIQEKILK